MELFQLGKLKVQPEVELSEKDIAFLRHYIKRHVSGDWGELADKRANDEALVSEQGILSVYPYGENAFVAVSTDDVRTTTTIYLPDSYIRDFRSRECSYQFSM